ncbi:MAG: hypothetical protein ONB42_05855 [candidate division KSB1 bacterium]|nr:hypothetical protein [candidate division KSB1 bacterium]
MKVKSKLFAPPDWKRSQLWPQKDPAEIIAIDWEGMRCIPGSIGHGIINEKMWIHQEKIWAR